MIKDGAPNWWPPSEIPRREGESAYGGRVRLISYLLFCDAGVAFGQHCGSGTADFIHFVIVHHSFGAGILDAKSSRPAIAAIVLPRTLETIAIILRVYPQGIEQNSLFGLAGWRSQ